ncbi:MAG: NAD(P)-binding domain-containing protein, partial [Nitriliruptoraceae bacterium]
MSAPLERIAVIGAGLVGSSIALAARAAGAGPVRITDRDPMVRTRAAVLEVADQVCEDLASTVGDAEVVIAAVPTEAVAE